MTTGASAAAWFAGRAKPMVVVAAGAAGSPLAARASSWALRALASAMVSASSSRTSLTSLIFAASSSFWTTAVSAASQAT